MKKRIYFGIVSLSLIFWSCDKPLPFDNSDYIYNPFSFTQDTLNNINSIQSTKSDVDWGDHVRSWVGETDYFKSGFSADFTFVDSSLTIRTPDSILFQLLHLETFNQNGADTLDVEYMNFSFYNTTDYTVDMSNSDYGVLLATKALNVKGGDNSWSYTLEDSLVTSQDTTLSLGIYPNETGALSMLYGGGSTIRPSLVFYFTDTDSAGDDSVTSLTFLADTLIMDLEQKVAISNNEDEYYYLRQLGQDSLILAIDIDNLRPAGDTLTHIASSKILPAISDSLSMLYVSGSVDSLQSFYMVAIDEVSGNFVNIEMGAGNTYYLNEMGGLIQNALDEGRSQLDLILRPSHVGYDPGFIAISQNALESALYVSASLAVAP